MTARSTGNIRRLSRGNTIIRKTQYESWDRTDSKKNISVIIDIWESPGPSVHSRVSEQDDSKELDMLKQIIYEGLVNPCIKTRKKTIDDRLSKTQFGYDKGLDHSIFDQRYTWPNPWGIMIHEDRSERHVLSDKNPKRKWIKDDIPDKIQNVWIYDLTIRNNKHLRNLSIIYQSDVERENWSRRNQLYKWHTDHDQDQERALIKDQMNIDHVIKDKTEDEII